MTESFPDFAALAAQTDFSQKSSLPQDNGPIEETDPDKKVELIREKYFGNRLVKNPFDLAVEEHFKNGCSAEDYAQLQALPQDIVKGANLTLLDLILQAMPDKAREAYDQHDTPEIEARQAGDKADLTRSQVSDQLIDKLHNMAVQKGMISDKVLKIYDEELNAAHAYSETKDTNKRSELLKAATSRASNRLQSGELSEADFKGLTDLMVLDTMVLDAVHHYEAAEYYPSAKERFKEYIGSILKDENRESRIATLADSVEKVLISFVHTTHPVGWFSQWGKTEVQGLSRTLEAMKGKSKRHEAYPNTRTSMDDTKPKAAEWLRHIKGSATHAEVPPLPQEVSTAVENTFNKWIEYAQASNVKSRKLLTPFYQATVAEEHQRENDNLTNIKTAVHDTVSEWRGAIAELKKDANYKQYASLLDKVNISETKEKNMYEERAWGRTADADGRPASTATELYRFIHDDVKDGHYKGPILDFRQNSRVHEQLVSSLIQRKFNDSKYGLFGEEKANPQTLKTFDKFSTDFMEGRNTKYANGKDTNKKKTWLHSKDSIFLQLDEDDKADFMKAVIKAGYDILPDQIGMDALAVSKHYRTTFNAFVEEHKGAIIAAGYSPEEVTINDFKKIKDPQSVYPLFGKLTSALASGENGFRFDSEDATGFRLMNMTPAQTQVDMYLEGTSKLDNNGERIKLENISERSTLMNVMRRMFVLKDAIDQFPQDKVATRYQLANFSRASDFYITLKLLEEANLAKIEAGTGKVTRTDIGIMPLLETIEDLRNAEKIATDLVKDDIASSYYEARGKGLGREKPVAEFMVGFSDSAATGGVLGSRWEIFKAMRTLTEIYAREGIEVRFLRGPGRGTDRGGAVEAGVLEDLVPYETQKEQLIHDATIQADLPTAMAASPAYAKHNIASIMLGLFTNHERALAQTDEQKQQMAQYEKGIDWIANRASEIFKEVVRQNPDTRKFLESVPANGNNTSRPGKRPGAQAPLSDKATPEEKSKYNQDLYDGIRMITKEYGFESADMPAFLVGVKQALEEFSAKSNADLQAMGIDAKGDGEAFMQEMKNHKFFRAILEVMRSGIKNYDPAVAQSVGEMTGCQEFVGKICNELNGLEQTLDRIAAGGKFAAQVKEANMLLFPERPLLHAIDKIAHSFMGAVKENWGKIRFSEQDPLKGQYPERVNIVNKLYCCNTALGQSRPNTPELYKLPTVGIAA